MGDYQDLIISERIWQALEGSSAADSIARELFSLKETIDRGADGAREASETVLANIEAAYLHTEAHRAALRLYLLSLTGELKPEDEPLRLIGGAIERGEARIKVAVKSGGGRKRRRLSK